MGVGGRNDSNPYAGVGVPFKIIVSHTNIFVVLEQKDLSCPVAHVI